MIELLEEIERITPDGGNWCDIEKASTLATLIVALRPELVVEIGVWTGGSAIPMALALRHVADKYGGQPPKIVAIDAWSNEASIQGQDGQNLDWWKVVDHDAAYEKFRERVVKHKLEAFVEVLRASSDSVAVPSPIGLCHIDGNHGEQAVRDVGRFAPSVAIGGFLVLDDLAWAGGGVTQAWELARSLAFRDLYPLGTGVVMQRTGTMPVR